MRAAGLDAEREQRRLAHGRDHPVVRHRLLELHPALRLGARRLLVLREREVDGPVDARHLPLGEREVALPHALSLREDGGERGHAVPRLGDEHDAGGLAIEAVRRRGLELGGGEVGGNPEVRARLLDQRGAGDAGAGVRGQPGRLVHGQEVLVLEQDGEGDLHEAGGRLGLAALPPEQPLLVGAHHHRVALGQDLVGLPPRAVHAHLARAEQLEDVAERDVLQGAAQELVEPLPGGVGADLHLEHGEVLLRGAGRASPGAALTGARAAPAPPAARRGSPPAAGAPRRAPARSRAR